jgi:hypothetical protein
MTNPNIKFWLFVVSLLFVQFLLLYFIPFVGELFRAILAGVGIGFIADHLIDRQNT